MDDEIFIQSKKLRRRIEHFLRNCDIDHLVMAADFLGIRVQEKLRQYRAQLNEKSVKKFS